MKKKVYRAGFIPFIVDETETIRVLMMQPSDPHYGGSKFQISKGKVEEGESFEEAAIREAEEELGLFQSNLIDSHELGKFLGRTTFYVGEVKHKDAFGMPHFETGDTKWMTFEEFYKEGRDIHIPVVKAAERLIRRLKNI